MANMTKAELQEKYDALLAEREEFTSKIVRIAAEKAIEHDLCTELEDCLKSVGIDVPETTVKVMRVETYHLRGFDAARILNDDGYWSSVEDKWDDVIGDYGYDPDESEVIQVTEV
jgi:hypothetical protein